MEINEELKQLIQTKPVTLCTVDKESSPHTIYVLYVKVIDSNRLLITDNYMTKTKENILANPAVSLSFLVGEAAFELNGTAAYFSDGEVMEIIKNMPQNKKEPCKGAIIVTVNNIVKMG